MLVISLLDCLSVLLQVVWFILKLGCLYVSSSFCLSNIFLGFLLFALFLSVLSAVPTIIVAHEFFDALPIHQFQVGEQSVSDFITLKD